MRVEFWAVDAGELALAVDQNAAAAAHAGAINHDRVETDHRVDVFLAGHFSNGLHHHDRTYGQNQVDAGAVLNQLAKFVGDKALVGVTAVVGGDHERVAHRTHFWLENYQLFVTCADDGDDAVAGALEGC